MGNLSYDLSDEELDLLRQAAETGAIFPAEDKIRTAERLAKKGLLRVQQPSVKKLRDTSPDNPYFITDSGDQAYRGKVAYKQVQAANLSGVDFSGKDLSGVDFSDLNLSGAVFTEVKANNANFSKANLGDAKFDDADLQNANFQRAFLEGADFRGSDLRGADFNGARLEGARFGGARMNGQTKFPAGVDPRDGSTPKGKKVPPEPPEEEVQDEQIEGEEVVEQEPWSSEPDMGELAKKEEEPDMPPGPFSDAAKTPINYDDEVEELSKMIQNKTGLSEKESDDWAEKMRGRIERGETVAEAYSSFLGAVLEEQIEDFKAYIKKKLKLSDQEADDAAHKYQKDLQQGSEFTEIVDKMVKAEPKKFKLQRGLSMLRKTFNKAAEVADKFAPDED